MTETDNSRMERALGRVEGNQSSMEARMDRFERLVKDGFTKVEKSLETISDRIGKLETKEGERSGYMRFGNWFLGLLGGAAILIAGHFWK